MNGNFRQPLLLLFGVCDYDSDIANRAGLV